MLSSTSPSLFECVCNRNGERLVQGVLRFALHHDSDFRREFCQWIDRSQECADVHEEVHEGVKDDIRLHDLVLDFADGPPCRIELKFHAKFTPLQRKYPELIDLLIVPEAQLHDATRIVSKERTKTWEEFREKLLSTSGFAQDLLNDFYEYAMKGDAHAREKIIETLRNNINGEIDAIDVDLLLQIRKRLGESKFKTTSATTFRREFSFIGFYVHPEHLDDYQMNYLWFGFVIKLDSGCRISKRAFVMQVMSDSLAKQLGVTQKLPDWYPFKLSKRGVEYNASDNGTFDCEVFWHACEELLKRYASLS